MRNERHKRCGAHHLQKQRGTSGGDGRGYRSAGCQWDRDEPADRHDESGGEMRRSGESVCHGYPKHAQNAASSHQTRNRPDDVPADQFQDADDRADKYVMIREKGSNAALMGTKVQLITWLRRLLNQRGRHAHLRIREFCKEKSTLDFTTVVVAFLIHRRRKNPHEPLVSLGICYYRGVPARPATTHSVRKARFHRYYYFLAITPALPVDKKLFHEFTSFSFSQFSGSMHHTWAQFTRTGKR